MPVVAIVKGPSFPVSHLSFGGRVTEKDVEIEQA